MIVTWRKIIACVLIALVGFNLRSVILGVPPVLPLIQHDLGLSYAATGLLTALPVLLLAVGAWPSGLLAERIGARLCVSIGLALLGTGALLRAFWLSAPSLFLFTLLLSLGIALTQTAIPVLVRRWFPKHIGLVAALFSDGLIIGEAVAAGVTVPIMVRFLGNDAWVKSFVLWGVPIIVLLAFWLWLAPPASASAFMHHSLSQSTTAPASAQSSAHPTQRRRISALHLGILVGGGSLIYFGMNGWIAYIHTCYAGASLGGTTRRNFGASLHSRDCIATITGRPPGGWAPHRHHTLTYVRRCLCWAFRWRHLVGSLPPACNGICAGGNGQCPAYSTRHTTPLTHLIWHYSRAWVHQ